MCTTKDRDQGSVRDEDSDRLQPITDYNQHVTSLSLYLNIFLRDVKEKYEAYSDIR